MKESRFRLDFRKKFSTVRLRLPKEVVNFPSLQVFKIGMDEDLSNFV